jgi:hypothetical protein
MKESDYRKIDGFIFIGKGKYLKDVFGMKVFYMPGGRRFEEMGMKCECTYIPFFKEEVAEDAIKRYIEGFTHGT